MTFDRFYASRFADSAPFQSFSVRLQECLESNSLPTLLPSTHVAVFGIENAVRAGNASASGIAPDFSSSAMSAGLSRSWALHHWNRSLIYG